MISIIVSFTTSFISSSFGVKNVKTGKMDIQKFTSFTEPNHEKKITNKSQFILAPEFDKSEGNININGYDHRTITMDNLKGKVVVVNFWTYSCINVLRTLPHLIDWNTKYADKGLVIVGVHSPEFKFEKDIHNVKAAIQRYGINYPIIQDNNHKTWNVYGNNYWPRMYIIDDNGYIRYDKIGEGGYNQTEKIIQSLLSERDSKVGLKNMDPNKTLSSSSDKILPLTNSTTNKGFLSQSVDFSKIKTKELYFGYQSPSSSLGNPQGFHPGQNITYAIPFNSSIKPNTIYLEGQWKNNPDNMELQSDSGRIVLTYSAKSVNLVAGGKGQGIVYEDNALLSNNSKGVDIVNDSKLILDHPRMYNLAMHDSYGIHSLMIDVKGKGFQAYTFTFG
ncbi:MAG: redoxin domain-containing protein [Candidatus Nitrosocosmicus sp.]